MLIKEMHVHFDLLLQKIASNQYGNISPSEVDRFLNQAMYEYIENTWRRVTGPKRGKNLSQKKLDDIRRLIRKNNELPLIAPSEESDRVDSYLYEPNMSYAHLPEDYLFLINSRAYTTGLTNTACNDELCLDRIDDKYKEYVLVLKFDAEDGLLCDNTLEFKIELLAAPSYTGGTGYGDVTIFDSNDHPSLKGIQKKEDKFKIINYVLEYINRVNPSVEFPLGSFSNSYDGSFEREYANKITWLKAYWEQYQDRYYQDCFIFVVREDNEKVMTEEAIGTGTNSAQYWLNTYNIQNSTSYTNFLEVPGFIAKFNSSNWGIQGKLTSGETEVFNRFKVWGYDQLQLCDEANYEETDVVSQWAANRQLELDSLYRTVEREFNKPTVKRPVSTMASDKLMVYTSGSFLAEKVKLDYIRRPRPLSLEHGWSCELAEQTHVEIVNKAVVLALETTQNPRAQAGRQISNIES